MGLTDKEKTEDHDKPCQIGQDEQQFATVFISSYTGRRADQEGSQGTDRK